MAHGITESRKLTNSEALSIQCGERQGCYYAENPVNPTITLRNATVAADVPCYANTSRPCFSTILSNLSAMPLGFLAPVSHFSTVLSLVFK